MSDVPESDCEEPDDADCPETPTELLELYEVLEYQRADTPPES